MEWWNTGILEGDRLSIPFFQYSTTAHRLETVDARDERTTTP
jgi:hypothetical protein